jgi:CrcB protein
MNTILAVAAGGAVGAVARYLLAANVTARLGTGFPYGTLSVNLLGCLLLGILAETVALKLHLPRVYQSMLATGFIGAFTTFSTFVMESVLLMERGVMLTALLYVGLSVVLGILAFMGGMAAIRLWAA